VYYIVFYFYSLCNSMRMSHWNKRLLAYLLLVNYIPPLHSTSDPTFHQSRTARHTWFTNCYWRQTFFICCSSHLEQTTLHRSICWNYWNLSYQAEDTPISRHCVIDICYPAVDLLSVKLAIRLDWIKKEWSQWLWSVLSSPCSAFTLLIGWP